MVMARQAYHDLGILFGNQFDEMDWPSVHQTLFDVPRMFSIWAYKQVMDIAPTNLNQKKYKPNHDPLCPSYGLVEETCSHVLLCEEIGRVYSLGRSIDNMATWLRDYVTWEQIHNSANSLLNTLKGEVGCL